MYNISNKIFDITHKSIRTTDKINLNKEIFIGHVVFVVFIVTFFCWQCVNIHINNKQTVTANVNNIVIIINPSKYYDFKMKINARRERPHDIEFITTKAILTYLKL